MKNKILHIVPFFLLLLVTNCTEEFEEINTDKTKLMQVSESEMAQLFTTAQIWGMCWLHSGRTTYWANSFCGYFTTAETSNEQMKINVSHVQATFRDIYTKAVPAIELILSTAKDKNKGAYHLAKIWKGYMMYQVADVWGPVPYSEAGNGKDVVPYESVKDIYYKILQEVTEAVDYFKSELQKNPNLNIFGKGDIIYNGNIAKWIKFANTMRLRLAIRISNVDPEKARIEAEAAINGPMMEENTDNAWVTDLASFNSSRYNALAQVSTWYQLMMTTSMESFLKGYNDPRMPVFFSPVENQNIRNCPDEIKSNIGGYHGLCSGYAASDYAFYRMYSRPGPMWVGPAVDPYKVPLHVKFAAETWFLKAEAALRGWNMGNTAKYFYEKGIEVSLRQWIPSITDQEITAYINGITPPANPDNYPYYDVAITDVPVKFADNYEKQYEQILTQKWLALFPDSWEAWAEYRRTRLPKIFPKKNSMNVDVDVSKGQIITRLVYPDSEKQLQPEQIENAIELLKGPDSFSTPLWWDTNINGE